ncbi:hypothetical protein ES319_D03G051900v1 [Gossypium barbadense]|uniref:Uncharacterized protein n=2 Tax=Gossypium TaxID=3633 RepID=A0A5J5S3W0_GOSBA|nr:hypothetical protein ES319_D03G051900v1 [Gossypium barbadense]TYG75743.1 hypothetical protein ES288_D03G057300v1 [Gossypium darwinii]
MDGILVHNPRHAREWWGVLRDSRGSVEHMDVEQADLHAVKVTSENFQGLGWWLSLHCCTCIRFPQVGEPTS